MITGVIFLSAMSDHTSPKSIGALIRETRTRKGMSQRALAEKCGAGQSTVSMWESGERIPSLASTLGIARALRITRKSLVDLIPQH